MSVTINSPASGATLKGTVTVTATFVGSRFDIATLTVDGKQLASDSAQPIAFQVDTARVPDGAHTLTVAVRAGSPKRWQKASIPVKVDNAVVPPSVTVTMNIPDGATIPSPTIWTAATSGAGVSKVEFLVDGVLKWTELVAPYQFNGDPDGLFTLPPGAHTLVARATAPGGTYEATAHVTVSAPPLPHNVALSAPTAVVTA